MTSNGCHNIAAHSTHFRLNGSSFFPKQGAQLAQEQLVSATTESSTRSRYGTTEEERREFVDLEERLNYRAISRRWVATETIPIAMRKRKLRPGLLTPPIKGRPNDLFHVLEIALFSIASEFLVFYFALVRP
jgi:hypothetical protein